MTNETTPFPLFRGIYDGTVEVPTTASQPKSIGDDAQFRARLADLYSAYDESIELGISEPNDRAVSKLIAVIDNFRAPAAQSSASIQEPVMVAEPMTLAGFFAEAKRLGCKIPADMAKQLAAPMVADPAGVAGFAELRTGLKKLNRTVDCEHLIHQLDALAATVKAVPSEALKLAAYRVTSPNTGKERLMKKSMAKVWDRSGYVVTPLYEIAAPMADKTDGGECTVPPAGWSCSRAAGHDGPCAASPDDDDMAPADDDIEFFDNCDREGDQP